MSEDSMPTVSQKPLIWQKAESDCMLPRARLTIGNTTKAADLMQSLWISNMIRLRHVSGDAGGTTVTLLVPEAPAHLDKPVEREECGGNADRSERERQDHEDV